MEPSLEILEDWEEWDPNDGTSFFVHALAGSLAGAAEHCGMFPFDTIKTYSQAAKSSTITGSGSASTRFNFQGPNSVVRAILRSGTASGSISNGGLNMFSFLRLWRGVSTMLTACVPAHAAYFSIFEHSKVALGANNPEHTPVASAMCGIFATIAHDMIMTPMDVIKQRLQLGFHSGPMDCARSIVRTEGVRALYLSFPTTLLMNIPYAGVMVATNESAKRILNPRNEYNVSAFVVSGAIAGSVAAVITNPLDVVKTRLQTQNLLNTYPNCNNLAKSAEAAAAEFQTFANDGVAQMKNSLFQRTAWNPRTSNLRVNSLAGGVNYGLRFTYTLRDNTMGNTVKAANRVELDCLCRDIPAKESTQSNKNMLRYNGFLETVKRIHAEEGLKGFSRGMGARLMVHAPSVAISWTTYETAKKALSSLS